MTSLRIPIDPAAETPPFEQLRVGILSATAAGTLTPGERLPTVRGLAAELDLAPGTVARAYRELETAGVVETRGRAGTFVGLDSDPVRREAQRAAGELVSRMRELGLRDGEVIALVTDALTAAPE
ncbi:GntR family transcriptional regulator [Microbacterium sp. 18062]|uniref:GntR family transcriptional regulator n=1 Tax=Microbacterium sp. 18062 TaxID=2681410 RepID=UPI00190F69DD|nr:GntR family transcriptional regulator [Microbacterium sp. 18062]